MLWPLFLFGGNMELIIKRLSDLNVNNPECVVADCVDSGRLPVLIDYITAREALYNMEVETYVR